MTMLLASVTGPAEVETVLAHGADIIDLKDPSRGALGALDLEIVRQCVAVVGGRRLVSAVIGDLPAEPRLLVEAADAMTATSIDYVKVGLFPGDAQESCVAALEQVARRCRMIGVLFADHNLDFDILRKMRMAGFAGAMLDTAAKKNGRLLDHRDVATLGAFVDTCHREGLMAGLAGSLEAPDVPRLLVLAPDTLGFRGALCRDHDRKAPIDPRAIQIIRELIPRDERVSQNVAIVRKVDYRLLAARGYIQESAETDRIFVRDLIILMRIGSYIHEQDVAQRVRFNIDADIMRTAHVAEDMRDVVSYDLIVDAIKLVAARERFDLVETLAERIAQRVLMHRRVQRVSIRVEKLDLGPGAVGIEITRERGEVRADVRRLFPGPGGDSVTR